MYSFPPGTPPLLRPSIVHLRPASSHPRKHSPPLSALWQRKAWLLSTNPCPKGKRHLRSYEWRRWPGSWWVSSNAPPLLVSFWFQTGRVIVLWSLLTWLLFFVKMSHSALVLLLSLSHTLLLCQVLSRPLFPKLILPLSAPCTEQLTLPVFHTRSWCSSSEDARFVVYFIVLYF